MQKGISEGVKKQPVSDSSKYYTANVYMIPPSARAHLNSLQNEKLMYILSCNSAYRYQIYHDYEQEAIRRYL